MRRIVYLMYSAGGIQGGHKVIVRHVEALRELGFNAVINTGGNNAAPSWFEYRAPILRDDGLNPEDDILVVPDDATKVLTQLSKMPFRPIVFTQGHINLGAHSLKTVELFPAERFPIFIGVSRTTAGLVRRLYPQADVETIPAFADERCFHPRESRADGVVAFSRKRQLEASFVRQVFPRLHPQYANLRWRWIENATETMTADALGRATLFLSLSRLEGLGLTPLEAMASGALCAGFTGIGGREFATPDNGFWVEEDDCEAAVEALAQAAEVVAAGGPELARRLEAGFETARRWSYAAFRERLEEVWMRLAPEARIKNGPLD